MFDMSWSEVLLIMVVGLIAVGPKDLPKVLYTVGKWVRQARYVASEFQHHFSDLMYEVELKELREQAKAAHEETRPESLAELVDPGGAVRRSLDPTHMSVGNEFPGSPPEPEQVADPPQVASQQVKQG